MRCYICDAGLQEPVFNADHGDIEPCPTCLIIIDKTVGSFGLKASADEEDFNDGPLFDYDSQPASVLYDN